MYAQTDYESEEEELIERVRERGCFFSWGGSAYACVCVCMRVYGCGWYCRLSTVCCVVWCFSFLGGTGRGGGWPPRCWELGDLSLGQLGWMQAVAVCLQSALSHTTQHSY
ncbi:hypothetical protein BU24DRAFT_187506 [Aaosphaeria arxii CBS 175.79]|uniref:Uncharacterized protein n=1 Tax=Aaosphaeria arxii CBS 175.79 TaxID=1450172 RepID=A0A6A5XUI5_9PLEO|nr:uncharacterized protein BU24DRAFT_187506 [Aaosphaeria arxii CBS 175.79]KAF2015904.1 hypothetical protein BU24DRAFT_187506 [Aaosphaeria arxii CBS 175.79]